MKKIFFILLSILSLHLSSQTIDSCYSFACNQMDAGNYENAITDFRRVLFFDNGNYSEKVSLKLADCYSKIGGYDKSIQFYDLAYIFSDDDTIKSRILFHKASTYILSGNYNFALIELLNIDSELSPEIQSRINFYKGIVFFQMDEFEKSRLYFSKLQILEKEKYLSRLDNIFKETKKLKRYNPKVTRAMSLFIPGSGQLYVGDYKNAANSFILTAGLIILFGYVAHDYSLLDAYLSVFPWYQRYYVGGFKSVRAITLYKKQEKKNEIYLELLEVIGR